MRLILELDVPFDYDLSKLETLIAEQGMTVVTHRYSTKEHTESIVENWCLAAKETNALVDHITGRRS